MQTWEKWYWGIVLGLMSLILVGIWLSEKGVLVKSTIKGKHEKYYISKEKSTLYVLAFFIGGGLVLWLLIKGVSWLLNK